MWRMFPMLGVLLAAATLVGLDGCKRTQPQDTLEKIRQEGVLRWGGDPLGGAPFMFQDPEDPTARRVIGFEIDIMDALARHMGVRHEMVTCDWDALIDNMRSRRTDMVLNGIEINDERAEQVAFSAPYYVYHQQLTVRQEDKGRYRSLDDLKGHKVCTLKAAESNNVLLRAGWTQDLILPLGDSEAPYRELELGRVDAVLQEDIIAAYYASPQRAPRLYNVPATFSPGRYGAAFRKQDKALLAEVDRILKMMMDSGELAAIYHKWGIWTQQQEQIGVKDTPSARTLPAATGGR